MMNLEFFSWASKASGDDRFRKMAISHADKTMLHHFRDDYSCYHVVSYDTITGMPHKNRLIREQLTNRHGLADRHGRCMALL